MKKTKEQEKKEKQIKLREEKNARKLAEKKRLEERKKKSEELKLNKKKNEEKHQEVLKVLNALDLKRCVFSFPEAV